ncbi:MAG TPA: hypothetical protein VGU67_03410 [Edaphobacter sp.]|nr:hypothetical protein [Edaphobacter sp.]
MTKPFHELRERLLRAGVAPRHVRRYLNELADHLADLTAEEEREGHSRADADSAALLRLGGIDDLAKAMTEQRQFQSWSARAPWAMFGVVPLLLLAAAWYVALFLSWSGLQILLPGAHTLFGGSPSYGFTHLYFAIDRAFFSFGAPILVGWGIGLIAARQRLKATWPAAGLVLLALIGGSARIHVNPTAVADGLGYISMGFTFGSTMPLLLNELVVLSLAALPYLIWRLHKARSLFA